MVRTAVSMLALIFMCSTLSLAQPHGKMEGTPAPRAMKERVMEKLNLTDQQKKDLQKLRLDLEKKETQIHSQIRLQRLDLQGLFQADNPDRGAIGKALKSIADLQYQAREARVDHWFSVRSMLTPEQQKIWKDEAGGFMEERGPSMMGGPHAGPMMRQHKAGYGPGPEGDEN